MQIISLVDNLHEMLSLFSPKESICMKCQSLFPGKKERIIKIILSTQKTISLCPKETMCVKCQSLFSGKNKENISKCHLLNFFSQHAKHLGFWISVISMITKHGLHDRTSFLQLYFDHEKKILRVFLMTEADIYAW